MELTKADKKRIEERAYEHYPIKRIGLPAEIAASEEGWEGYVKGATEQKAIDESNPSDELIMRILNAIGYEEESWIPIVREHLKAMEE